MTNTSILRSRMYGIERIEIYNCEVYMVKVKVRYHSSNNVQKIWVNEFNGCKTSIENKYLNQSEINFV